MPRPAVDEIFTAAWYDPALATVHGPAPRLRTADGWATYVTTYPVAEPHFPAIRTRPATMTAPSMTVHVQMASDTGFKWMGIYLTALNGGGGADVQLSEQNTSLFVDAPARTWIRHTFTLAPGIDYDRRAVESLVAQGQLEVLAAMDLDGDFDRETGFHLSQLDLILGPLDQPLRWRQRDDGLGVSGPARARGGTSRQRSNRARGYL